MLVGLYDFKNAFWACAFYHGCILLPTVTFCRDRWLPSATWPSAKIWLCLIGIGIVSTLIAMATYTLMGDILLSDRATIVLLDDIGCNETGLWDFLIFVVVINPFLEEFFWRGIVFNVLDSWNVPIPH